MSRKIQLFCIPYAGGYAEVFTELAGLLESQAAGGIQVILLEYAGHGERKREPYYRDFEELTADVVRQIQAQREPGCPYAILGYSMGSIAVYEALADGVLDTPEHIFLAAHEAPDVEWECKSYSRLDDDEFLDELLGYGGFPEKFDRKLLKNRFFRRLYFEPIRRDYDLLASYRMKKWQLFCADVTVFYAPKDIAPEAIRSWERFAGRGIAYIELGDNHFFIRSCAEEMAEVIREKLFPGNV